MMLTHDELIIKQEILMLSPGQYTFNEIFNKTNTLNIISKSELRWVISSLIKDGKSSFKRICRGVYGVNLKNNEFQRLLADINKKYLVYDLININKSFISFQTQLYNYKVLEGIPHNEKYIVSDEYINKVLIQDAQKIVFKKFKYESFGKIVFFNYLKYIKDDSYSSLPILFDVIKKYHLEISNVLHVVKSKDRLIYKIFKLLNGYKK